MLALIIFKPLAKKRIAVNLRALQCLYHLRNPKERAAVTLVCHFALTSALTSVPVQSYLVAGLPAQLGWIQDIHH